jgi:hypothetical protein
MRSQDHDVVLVKRTFNLGCWEFGMWREWGGVEKGEVSLQVTWGQGGRDPITPRRVKGNGRETKGNWQGEQKQGDCATLYCQSVYMYIIIV